jgi:predicted nucleic acid-binding protein
MSFMSDRVFVDTNILIYAHDVDAGRKHDVAAQRVRDLWISRDGVVSLQVLQELYVNVTRKIPKPLSRKAARELIGSYAAWVVQRVDASDLVRASEVEERHKLSFWDALIVVAASKATATTLLTEDLNDGQRIEGVRIENPFRRA